MKKAYGIEWFPESGASFPLRVFLHKDTVTVALDTTGESLHKRGYRTLTSKAPITETLAAALIMLTPWKSDRSSWTRSAEAEPSDRGGDDRSEYGAGHETGNSSPRTGNI